MQSKKFEAQGKDLGLDLFSYSNPTTLNIIMNYAIAYDENDIRSLFRMSIYGYIFLRLLVTVCSITVIVFPG